MNTKLTMVITDKLDYHSFIELFGSRCNHNKISNMKYRNGLLKNNHQKKHLVFPAAIEIIPLQHGKLSRGNERRDY